jgi:hypothetical protein
MTDRQRMYIGIAIIAIVAFAVVALPSGGDAITLASAALQSAFLAAMAVAGVRLYRTQGEWLSGLTDRNRGILFGSIAIALVTIVAHGRFMDITGGIILEIILLGGCALAAFLVWRDSRRYVI